MTCTEKGTRTLLKPERREGWREVKATAERSGRGSEGWMEGGENGAVGSEQSRAIRPDQ